MRCVDCRFFTIKYDAKPHPKSWCKLDDRSLNECATDTPDWCRYDPELDSEVTND